MGLCSKPGVANFLPYTLSHWGCVLAVLLSLSPGARAQTSAVLVNRQLKPEKVTLLGLGDKRVVYFDHQRVRRDKATSGFVRIRSIGGAKVRVRGGSNAERIVLTDGQRFTGQLMGATSDGQAVVWAQPALGTTTIKLTDIAGMITAKPKPEASRDRDEHEDANDLGQDQDQDEGQGKGESDDPSAPKPNQDQDQDQPTQADPWAMFSGKAPAKDVLRLANGDTLRGFVEAWADQRLAFTPQGSDEPIQLPLRRVRSIRLANPRQSPKAGTKAHRLMELIDGTRVLARSVLINHQTARLIDPSLDWTRGENSHQPNEEDSYTLPLKQVLRVDLTGSSVALDDLTSMDWKVTDGGKVFGVSMAPRLQDTDLLIHAPITLAFVLPPQAERFAADLVLDPPKGVPDERLAWARCTLKVHHGTDRPATYRFDSDQRSARINLPIHQATLKLELDPAANGPILDRLRLTNAMILRRIGEP